MTVPSFSIETPEFNFQRSVVHQASRRQKTQPVPTFGFGVADMHFLRMQWRLLRTPATVPDQFVRTKLSQLEVPEALRTSRFFKRAPVFGGEVNLAARFFWSMDFFQIPQLFFELPPARFPVRGGHNRRRPGRVNRFSPEFCKIVEIRVPGAFEIVGFRAQEIA
jgi:hypothetical protein